LAVQAVLNLVIGSVLLDRQIERQPAQHPTAGDRPSTGDDESELLAHPPEPIDEEELFRYTLAALVGTVTTR
jgi:hypothetical protein